MGILVSAAVAGRLVDRHERVVRGRIVAGDLPNARKNARGAWQVDVDDLASIPGWVVDREELARLALRSRRGHSGLVARVEALEARVRLLEARLNATLSTHGGDLPALPPGDALRHVQPSDLTLSALQGHSPVFSHKSAAAQWLSAHGVNPYTVRSWRGWPPDELTPMSVLRFALDIQTDARARGDWRVTWRLSQCADSGCVCRDLLAG